MTDTSQSMWRWEGVFYFYNSVAPATVLEALKSNSSFPVNIVRRQGPKGRTECVKTINVFPYEVQEKEYGLMFEGDVDDVEILGVQGGAFHELREDNHMMSLGETPFLDWQPRRTF